MCIRDRYIASEYGNTLPKILNKVFSGINVKMAYPTNNNINKILLPKHSKSVEDKTGVCNNYFSFLPALIYLIIHFPSLPCSVYLHLPNAILHCFQIYLPKVHPEFV